MLSLSHTSSLRTKHPTPHVGTGKEGLLKAIDSSENAKCAKTQRALELAGRPVSKAPSMPAFRQILVSKFAKYG